MAQLSDDELMRRVEARGAYGSNAKAADALGIDRRTFDRSIKRAAERGLFGTDPVMPGFRISQTTITPSGGKFIQQKPEAGEHYEMPPGFTLKRDSAYTDADGRRTGGWKISEKSKEQQLLEMRAAIEGFKDEIPRAEIVTPVSLQNRKELLNQFTITDLHFGSLSWAEETGHDYDLSIAEHLVMDWFAAAIEMSPPAHTAILAQIGDLVHYDGFESKTPASGHILDGDSRFPKMVRVVIRTMRRVIRMLLEKHDHVHIIMADANHDPASEAWLREMFAAFFDSEPRISVDKSAMPYYVYEHGDTSLFFHHGNKRKVGNVDTVFAGQFREIYGRTKYSYAHLGHLHSDELKSTNLMKVERHETLAAPDAYAAGGGWLSGRSAKVITYHSVFGEVARMTLTPEMVNGWSSANDNTKAASAA